MYLNINLGSIVKYTSIANGEDIVLFGNASTDQAQMRQEVFPLSRTKDALEKGRYIVDLTSPLPAFSYPPFAESFVANCPMVKNKQFIATVISSKFPYRFHEIVQLKEAHGQGLVAIEAAEIVELSEDYGYRLVTVSTVPKGVSLSEHITQHGPLKEEEIINRLLPALLKALRFLDGQKITHGAINPDNIYYEKETGNYTILSPFSYPCGYFQSTIYESFERMNCVPIGKSNSSLNSDFFALGITIIYCLTGGESSVFSLSESEIISRRISHGSYNLLANDIQVNNQRLKLLLQGLLYDSVNERWGINKVSEWIKGNKINLPIVSVYPSTKQPYKIKEERFFHNGELAHNLANNWELATNRLRDPQLIRWIEKQLLNETMAEKLNFVVKSFFYGRSNAIKEEDEFIAKCLLILDPNMPIRMRSYRLEGDTLGKGLAYAYANSDHECQNAIVEIINRSLANFAEDVRAKPNQPAGLNEYISMLDKSRKLMQKNDIGFGLERCLYELNPWLPCQSEHYSKYHITSLSTLLERMDQYVAEKQELPVLDRHITAFIASRTGMQQEIQFPKLRAFPEFYGDFSLKTIAFFAVVHEGRYNLKLPNLMKFLAAEAEKLVELYKCKSIKQQIKQKIKKALASYNLKELLKGIVDLRDIKADRTGFKIAVKRYNQLESLINQYQDQEKIFEIGYNYGFNFALLSAYIILGGVTLILMGAIFNS